MLAVLLGVPLLAHGQTAAPRVTLAEVIGQAATRNPSLAAAGVEIATAEAQILESYGRDDLVVDATASWQASRESAVAGQPFQNLQNDRISLSGGVTRALPSGGSVGLRLGGDYVRTLQRFEFEIPEGSGNVVTGTSRTEVWSPSATLSFYQPLLRGFGSDAVLAPRRRARAARTVAELERAAAVSGVVRDIEQGYWELVYAYEEMEILRASLSLAQEQLRIVQAGIDVGRLAPTASAEVAATIALREEAVFIAEQGLSEQALELRRLAGMEIGPGAIDLAVAAAPEVAPVEPDLDAALADALSQNPELQAVRARGEAATIEVQVAENGMLPQLDFQASFGPSGNSEDPGEALGQMVGFDAYSLGGSLTFSTPIGRRAARGALARARAGLHLARLTEADVRAQIAVAVVRAVNLVRSAKKRADALAKSTELATINLDTEKARFEVGRATNFDVLRRQDELAQARLHQARARIDYLKAVAALESLTGALLERHGVKLTHAGR